MAKERKQDLSGPEDADLEQRVHDMLDITVDEAAAKSQPDATKKSSKRTAVTVTHADDEPDEAPLDPEVVTAITETNAALQSQFATAPLVAEEPKATPSKKVTVTHADDPEEPLPIDVVPAEPEVEPTAPVVTVDEPAEPAKESEVVETATVIPVKTTPDPVTSPKDSVTVGDLMDQVSPLESAIDSTETDKAVTDIIASESDAILESQAPAPPKLAAKPKKQGPGLFKLIITSSGFRWVVFLLLIAGLAGLGAYPKTRYYALNKAGVTSTASVTVLDQSTLRPLKNVTATLAGKSATSNQDGVITFAELPLGPTTLVIDKRAFADYSQPVTVGWGSNPFADINLKPQGSQYEFKVTDLLSGKPIAGAEATMGELSAIAGSEGEITLTLDELEGDTADVVVTAAGYKPKTVTINLTAILPEPVTLAPSKQVAFISQRSGNYDLYKVDADGTNETLVLKGTGKESNGIVLLQHPTDDIVLLISTREGTHTADGSLQQTLTYVNLKDGETKSVVSSSQLRAIDWIGTRLVYVQLKNDSGAEDTDRYQLMSYDYRSGDNRQLASTNYFNSVVSAGGKIYYAPASAFQNGINLGVFAVHADGSGKQVLLDKESWNLIRTAYDVITIAVQQDWYEYRIGSEKPVKTAGQPSDTAPRVYSNSPDGKHSARVDTRDGKQVVVLYDNDKNTESTLVVQAGAGNPIRWLNNSTLVYRVATSQESADYVISIEAGAARKITDVTDTGGIDRWAY